jgi:hypothetical protein
MKTRRWIFPIQLSMVILALGQNSLLGMGF